jgi:hypothetical protein
MNKDVKKDLNVLNSVAPARDAEDANAAC